MKSVVKSPVYRGPVSVVPLALKYTQIRAPKTGVAQRVAHGIYRGINIAQIVEEVPQLGRYTLARRHRFQQH